MKVDVAVMRNAVEIFQIVLRRKKKKKKKVWCLTAVPHAGCVILSLYSRTMSERVPLSQCQVDAAGWFW